MTKINDDVSSFVTSNIQNPHQTKAVRKSPRKHKSNSFETKFYDHSSSFSTLSQHQVRKYPRKSVPNTSSKTGAHCSFSCSTPFTQKSQTTSSKKALNESMNVSGKNLFYGQLVIYLNATLNPTKLITSTI